jgi:hypothetical protein
MDSFQMAYKNKNKNKSKFCDNKCKLCKLTLDICDCDNNEFLYRIITPSKYFFLDILKRELVNISCNDFKRRDFSSFEFRGLVIKFRGPREQAKKIFSRMFDGVERMNNNQKNFKSEGLIETIEAAKEKIKNFLEGLSVIFSTVAKVGEVSNAVNAKYENFKNTYLNVSASSKANATIVTELAMKLMSLLIVVKEIVFDGIFTHLKFVSLFICVYSLFNYVKVISKVGFPFRAESLETIMIAGISAFLPSSCVNLLRKMQTLTSKKLFDEQGIIFEFMTVLHGLLMGFCDYLPEFFGQYVKSMIELFGIAEFGYIQQVKKVLEQWVKDRKVILSNTYRSTVLELDAKLREIDIKKFFSKNKMLSAMVSDFNRMVKAINAYESTARMEPTCFVFEGPPGCRKSVTVNKIIRVLGETHYAHVVKSTEDGKDWYDSYNNETIFYMDDVGQMGKSQWRKLINWISAVKLPLDCAEAELKDTKFFNSELVLLTTNKFQTLSGFTAKDCIDTPEALWRRGFVFDFANVTPHGDGITGNVTFRYFDLNSKSFVDGFPQDFKDFLALMDVELATSCDCSDQNTLLVWFSDVINGFRAMRKGQLEDNTLNEDDITNIRKRGSFYTEGLVDGVWDIAECFTEYFSYVSETAQSLFGSMLATIYDNPILSYVGMSILVIIYFMTFYGSKLVSASQGAFLTKISDSVDVSSILDGYERIPNNDLHTLSQKAIRQVYEVMLTVHTNEKFVNRHCYGVVSERFVILPYHLVHEKKVELTIYKDKKANHILVDHMVVEVVYFSIEEDVAVLQLSKGFPSPFPKLDKCFRPLNGENPKPVGLGFPNECVKLEGILSSCGNKPVVYETAFGQLTALNTVKYNSLHFPGMCGVPVLSQEGLILGVHVAGSDIESTGVTMVWSEKRRRLLFDLLTEEDNGLKLKVGMSGKVIPDSSAIKIETDLSAHTPKNSNFVKSPLHGAFPISRIPANLSVYGKHTVKDIAKQARAPINSVNQDELDFAEKVISQYFAEFKDLSMEKVIKGDEVLSEMNRKSSNGIFPLKTKEECFDYAKGEMTEKFAVIFEDFVKKMSTGDVDLEDILWTETLKDELRGIEKKTPRSFRVCPVTMQVLTKLCFGNMVKHIFLTRDFNEIMIGVNPFTEWDSLYKRLSDLFWDGDIKFYDKSMLVQAQQLAAKVILKFYKGDYPEAARNILENIAHSAVLVNDDAYITTHSLPSGSWLTAFFNSLVNRIYTAMWYYRELTKNGIKPLWYNFHRDLMDLVYGDDRLNSLLNKDYAKFLNAETMAEFFESIGMGMTDSTKNKIQKPFNDIEEITFLKRSFVFHPTIGKIVCPLDLRTVYSTLSWIDSSKNDLELVMQDKISAFQREMFLHSDLYESHMVELKSFCDTQGVPCKILPKEYLISLYKEGGYDTEYNKKFGVLSV